VNLFASALIAAPLSVSAAHADVLFNSLTSPNSGSLDLGIQAINIYDQSFQTGSAPLRLSDVAISLDSKFSTEGDVFTVSLKGGVPLADLSYDPANGLNIDPLFGPVIDSITLLLSGLSTSLTTEHFDQFAGIALQANTFYWIEIGIPSIGFDGDSLELGMTKDTSGVGVAGGYNASQITDTTFFPNAPPPSFLQMEVTGAAVAPEPSTWALMLVGLAGLGLAGRSHRSSRSSPT
jgi:PEP-CTERM motif